MVIKIAVVGAGNVARNSYLPYLSKQKDVVLTYYSRTRSKAEACAGIFGGRIADSIQELLADEPDAVLVLTGETQRFDAAMALLEGRPKRLFFEKPLVARNGQAKVCEDDFFKARELLQRAGAVGTETAMVFNYRFFDQTMRAQKAISDRHFGKLTQASLFVNYACWSHCIDLLHLFGGRASRISALAGDIPYQGAVDVAGSFLLLNGAVGTILGTGGSHFDFPLYDVIFNFERGNIRFSDLDGPVDIFDHATRYRESHTLTGNRSRWDQYQASFHKSLAAYLDSIRHGAPPPVRGLAGLEELQFEAALRRSIAQKRPVDVQQEFPLGT
ncbi:MAG: Gfo/Idh/MocA family oxidoreductase [Planctomycetota bacterium]